MLAQLNPIAIGNRSQKSYEMWKPIEMLLGELMVEFKKDIMSVNTIHKENIE